MAVEDRRIDEIEEKVIKLEIKHADFKATQEAHAEDIQQLRESTLVIQDDIQQLRGELSGGLREIDHSITKMTIEGLKAIPPHVANELAEARHNSGIGWTLAAALLAALVAAIGWVVVGHG